jgi:FlaA1/EpsC-like NDP-sugar epimerase
LKVVKLPSHSYSRNLATTVLALPRLLKRTFVFISDVILCVGAVYFAFYLRLGYWVSPDTPTQLDAFLLASFCSLIIALPIFVATGLYRTIFRYSGLPALLAVTKAIGIYAALYFLVFTLIGIDSVPRTIGLIQPILLLLFVGASRAVANFWLGRSYSGVLKKNNVKKVLIYGAGSAGRQLAGAIDSSHDMRVMGFIDDDQNLQGHIINGLRVYQPDELARLISNHNISDVLLALPSLSRARRNAILQTMAHAKVKIQTLPALMDLAQGRINISDIKELDIEDLLIREVVTPDSTLLFKNIKDRVVLITGAGGSIGSELCRQIILYSPKTMVLVEQSELALYEIHRDLCELNTRLSDGGISIIPLLASVVNRDRMRSIIGEFTPSIIYHAAAYKHVPLVESNVVEGVRNNSIGTLVVAQIACELRVPNFILISTDKAVRPTNVMGASKRVAELILQGLADFPNGTKFSMVRFGNVLNSSGSVVPKFRSQIKEGGPVTVTDFRMTRYFMTIPEAAQLVIQAGALAKGGDVFLLDMGEPVKILDLAKKMIELSGLTIKDDQNVDGDIEIVEIGLRPGEKLYEELLIFGDPEKTMHPRIFKSHEEFLPWDQLEPILNTLHAALDKYDEKIVFEILSDLVSGYQLSSIRN